MSLTLAAQAADEIVASASLDRQRVFTGDAVALQIEVADLDESLHPDYLPLLQDFELRDPSSTSTLDMTTAERVQKQRWTVWLEPKRSGQFVIPALRVGPYRTQALSLTVQPRRGVGPEPGQDIFIETDIEPRNPYVQAQVLYRIRLYHADMLTEGDIDVPLPPDTVAEQLGDDLRYQTQVGERSFRVIERRYALFVERSGVAVIPPARFDGIMVMQNLRAGFGAGMRRNAVSLSSQPIQLDVRPQAEDFDGRHWLAAKAMEMEEVWPNGEPQFVVGEPVTRKFVIRATGLITAQLPAITMPPTDGLKVYPDQPVFRSATEGAWKRAEREESFAIVPTKAGPLDLPEVSIPWWSTVTDAQQLLVIPGRRFEVAGTSLPTGRLPIGEATAAMAVGHDRSDVWSSRVWPAVALSVTALWLATLWLWLRPRAAVQTPDPDAPAKGEQLDRRAARVRLAKACDHGDAKGIAQALLTLARQSRPGPSPSNLLALAACLDDTLLKQQILALDQCLYGHRGGSRWSAAVIVKRGSKMKFKNRQRKEHRARNKRVLPSLYPPAS